MSRKNNSHQQDYDYARLFLRRFTVAKEIIDFLPSIRRILDEKKSVMNSNLHPEEIDSRVTSLLEEAKKVHKLKLLAVDHAEGTITLDQMKLTLVLAGYTFPGSSKIQAPELVTTI